MPAILKGEVSYINGTTYLASQVLYTCTSGNRISGSRIRFCGPDGRWTSTSPKCEEVRCDAPELPANGSAVYIGNDRSFKEQSFSVGVTVQYECDYGHVVKGNWASRLCQANGEWSGEPPVCVFVDCGQAPSIENGNYVLRHPPAGSTGAIGSATPIELSRRSDNGNGALGAVGTFTYYGTIAHYSCDSNFKLQGPAQRECLENGHWRTPLPTCEPVQCPKPEFFDEYTQVSLIPKGQAAMDAATVQPISEQQQHQSALAKSIRLIANNQWIHPDPNSLSFGVGDKLHFSCLPGYVSYGGPDIRTCTQYGQWSGSSTPRCRQIDCGRPAPIGQEGRFHLLNETTTFNSLVEYACVRPFKLIEVKIRQAGNLIETLSNAQLGVTPILTSLPIGVKVCANNGQWMPNDQQPKCTTGGLPAETTNSNGHFDGIDNSLDGSNRVQILSQGHSQHHPPFDGSINQDGDSSNLDRQQTGGSQSSLWAKIVVAICLLVMLALIILTLICIRSGKKPKQVAHRTSILTSSGHQAAAAAAVMQLQLANSKALGQQHQQQIVATSAATPAANHQRHHLHPSVAVGKAAPPMLPGQNLYVNGMQKMFPGAMVGQSQMSSGMDVDHHASYGDASPAAAAVAAAAAALMNGNATPRSVITVNGQAGLMMNGKSSSLGILGHPNNRSRGGVVDSAPSASSSGIMEPFSRLSIDSDHQNNNVMGGGNHQSVANKTIRHNPNGLVTFVSPAQQQQQQQSNQHHSQHHLSQQPSSSSSSGVSSTSHKHQISPHSISTSLSVSASSSPSSSSSSSAHHTSATRLSGGTDSTGSPASVNQQHHHHQNVNKDHQHHHTQQQQQQSEYQAPQQFLQQDAAAQPQASPPSLPAHPPPPHRVQQHHRQLMKHQANPSRQPQQVGRDQSENQMAGNSSGGHHYMDPSV